MTKLDEKLYPKLGQFLHKLGHLFPIFNKGRVDLLSLSSYAPVYTGYLSVFVKFLIWQDLVM